MPCVRHSSQLPERLVEYLARDRFDISGLLCEGYELVGWDEALSG